MVLCYEGSSSKDKMPIWRIQGDLAFTFSQNIPNFFQTFFRKQDQCIPLSNTSYFPNRTDTIENANPGDMEFKIKLVDHVCPIPT